MNKMEKKYAGACSQLTAFLDELEPLEDGYKHYVRLWAADDFGPRISEFGWVNTDKNGGAAIMRGDWPYAPLIFAAEEFLLMAACDWPEKTEGLKDAKERLRALYAPKP